MLPKTSKKKKIHLRKWHYCITMKGNITLIKKKTILKYSVFKTAHETEFSFIIN